MNPNDNFDITVIGAGHAGVEAAWIAASFGFKICVVTMKEVPIASMPCNPSVGGVGKGQVVREVDALGGMMGKLADMSGIQYRTLNDSKGYAVRSTRVQTDKVQYSKWATKLLEENLNITVLYGTVTSVEEGRSRFVISFEDRKKIVFSRKLVVTTGTYLDGITHVGTEQKVGGQYELGNSPGLDSIFKKVKTLPNRFKTGTPARLDKDSINFSKLVEQKSCKESRNFHSMNAPFERNLPQVSCFLSRTNEQTLGIIRENKDTSPLFNGQIKGVGPRYCPSIEDKAFRYPDRNSHHIFIEPEGIDSNSIYPSGLSTSLPKEVQKNFLQTISGFEKVEILSYGYAVEYDVVDTTKLDRSLEYMDVPGLYFAGQINGTSGYEEAAGQGIIAGINASLSLKGQEPLILDRNDSYIGVLIEDLVSNSRDEPYRLFTARSENRLYIREDNTLERMYKYRKHLKLATKLDDYQVRYMKELQTLYYLAQKTLYKANCETREYFKKRSYGSLDVNITLGDLLKRSKLDPVETLDYECKRFGVHFSYEAVMSCAVSLKYEGYINRANLESEKLNQLGRKKINWEYLVGSSNISTECKQRILSIRPATFSELQRIEGIRPATLAYVAGNCV